MRRALSANAVAVALVALGVVAAGGLAGCDGQPEASPTTSSTATDSGSSTSATPSTPTESGGSTEPAEPPALPEAAKQQTRAGAKAFVRHYVDVLNYSWREGTSMELRELAHPSCNACNGLAEFIDGVYENGGYQRGGEWRLVSLVLVPGQVDGAIIATPVIAVLPGKWRESADKPEEKIRRHRTNYEFRVVDESGRWRMKDIES